MLDVRAISLDQLGSSMKTYLVAAISSFFCANAFAEACWNESEYKDQWLIRASQCSENVSLSDFARGFCLIHVEGDTPRKAAKCPATVKTKEGTNIVTQSIIARCLGINPPGANGKANTVYYSGSAFADSRESLRELCVGFDGKWVEGTK